MALLVAQKTTNVIECGI